MAAVERRFKDPRIKASLARWGELCEAASAAMRRMIDERLPEHDAALAEAIELCNAAERRHRELLSEVSLICKCCARKLQPGARDALCSRRCRRMHAAIDRRAR